jgi:ADP-dependent NAD(P)H-hydrate dehydratase / NAD(P)H-hydrate epimerase
MQQHPYWQRQGPLKPLFPDIEWNKPEQKSRAGKLVIIGGNSGGFASLAESYQLALATGAGEAKILLPDTLQKLIPPSITDTMFMPSNPSGGFSKNAHSNFLAASQWADATLLIGDMGRNSETAMLCEMLLRETTRPLIITRDAVDLLKNAATQMLERENTVLVVSFAQLQKIFQAVYYPKVLTLSMQLSLLIEALHKFTITYACTVVTYHSDNLIIAHEGKIVTTPWTNTMALWRGSVATKAACYLLWTPNRVLESITASFIL